MLKDLQISLLIGVILLLFCPHVKGQNIYETYNQNWSYTLFVTNIGGGGGVSANITNDVLTVSFGANFATGQMKRECIVPLNTTPALPNILLGQINVSLMGSPIPNAYQARINNGFLCIEGANAVNINDFQANFSVNLRDLIAPKYTYKSQVTLYGYSHNIPIAEVANAALNQVAYTSFESSQETPTWTYSPIYVQGHSNNKGRTGDKYFHLSSPSATIQRNSLPAGKYLLTYWENGTGSININGGTILRSISDDLAIIEGWKYQEHLIQIPANGSVTLSNAQGMKIDELRLYPEKAVMSTQTYDLQKGITSKTDALNISEFYEYDDFGRLRYVRDEQGNIIKQNTYYLKPQN